MNNEEDSADRRSFTRILSRPTYLLILLYFTQVAQFMHFDCQSLCGREVAKTERYFCQRHLRIEVERAGTFTMQRSYSRELGEFDGLPMHRCHCWLQTEDRFYSRVPHTRPIRGV